MKKAAVIFPGLGYGPDRPLLYYAGKIAKECGYDLISIKYNGIDKATLRDISKMPDAFNLASQQAKEQLSGAGLAECDDVLFISKSIGTVAAATYAAGQNISAGQLFFTPFPQAITLATEGGGLVFIGDKDQWVDDKEIRSLCEAKKISFNLISGANHSLETGHTVDDVDNLAKIIGKAAAYISGENR